MCSASPLPHTAADAPESPQSGQSVLEDRDAPWVGVQVCAVLPPGPTQRRMHPSPPGLVKSILGDRDAPWDGMQVCAVLPRTPHSG